MLNRIIYRCQYVEKPLNIDGIVEKEAWNNAEILEFFIPVPLKTPVSKTQAKLLYDDKYLYIGFKCYDNDIRATYTERDSFTWEQEVVETFIKTSVNQPEYFEFEFSPLMTIFDAFLPGPEYRLYVIECSRWNCNGIVVKSYIKGTLNDSSDIDEYWSIEIGIPFKSLPTLKKPLLKKMKDGFFILRDMIILFITGSQKNYPPVHDLQKKIFTTLMMDWC